MDNSIAYKLAQLPKDALLVGIDPHKQDHVVSVKSHAAEVLARFKVKNVRPGFEELLDRCDRLCQQHGVATCVFGIEAGAHYWRNLAYFLAERKRRFHLVNPWALKQQRDADDLMRRKNDYRDADTAAELLRQGRFTWTTLPQGLYAELRSARQVHRQLVTEAARLKLELITALDGLFPEFMTVFKCVDGQTALTILATGANPAVIAGMSEDDFVAHVHQAYGGQRFQIKKVRALYRVAQSSVGIQAGAEAQDFGIQLLSDRLAHTLMQCQWAEDHIVEVFAQCSESPYLLSVPGLGAVNAASILAHIGNIEAYSSAKQLAKMAGTIPTENSSAGHATGRTTISKKGRPDFRLVLYRSVIGLLRHNQTFIQYTKRLTERPTGANPLKKKEAVIAAVNKLLHIIYALLTKRQMFNPAKA
jgi:transposase